MPENKTSEEIEKEINEILLVEKTDTGTITGPSDTFPVEEKKPEELTKEPKEDVSEKGEEQETENKGEATTVKGTQEGDKENKEKQAKEEEAKLILGKFKSQEDFEKAYQEAEKKISQQGEESSLYKKKLSDYSQHLVFDEFGNVIPSQQVQPQPGPQVLADPLEKVRPHFPGLEDEQIRAQLEIMGMMVNRGIETYKVEQEKNLKPLYAIQSERAVEAQKAQVRAKYTDYSEYADVVDSRLASLPPNVRANAGAVEMIFLTTRGEHTPELVEKAKKVAQAKREEISKKADNALVEGAGQTAVPSPPKDMEAMTSDQLLKEFKSRGGKITENY